MPTSVGRLQRHGRPRNPRGQGYLLRADIVAGATAILERTGSEESVTLRAIAREIGITAPSIADHFADRADIIDAVVAQEVAGLSAQLASAADSAASPVDALMSAWRSYVEFGRAHPAKYRVIFQRRFLDLWQDDHRPMIETLPVYTGTIEMMIGLVQRCIDAGLSTSSDAVKDSVSIWYFVHGMVALPPAITSFEWPDYETNLVEVITELAHLK